MKKLLNSVFVILAITLGFCFFGCGSTSSNDEPAISTIEANHIRVDVTKSTVKVTLTTSPEENIKTIDVIEVPFGSVSSVKMTENKVSFIWPFAEKNKEYTLCAKFLLNDKEQEEYVSFKTEGDIKSIINYSEKYNTSVFSLIAKSNQRFLKCDTSFDVISSVLKGAKTENAKLTIALYSGKHFQATQKDAVLVASKTTDFNKNAISQFTTEEGLDIIEHSQYFGMSAKQLNAALSKNLTYFALATVDFTLSEQQNINFTAKGVFSNDTIYTPIAESELIDNENSANAK